MPLPLCVRVEDEQSAKSLEADGWYRIETLEIWSGTIQRRPISPYLSIAYMEHCSQCVDLAGRVFKYDRLHRDEKVPNEEADEFKRQCVRDAFAEHEGFLWVYRVGYSVRGFLIVRHGRVQMVAVDPEFRGIGRDLFGFLEGHLEAGTQSDNEPAKRLYASLGMTKTRTLRTFHKWP